MLYALPSSSPRPGHGRKSSLRLRPEEEIESELDPWRRACADAHAALSGPLLWEHPVFQSKVTRVVAHTMRLLMRLRHFTAAKELDRAFFTTEPAAPSRPLDPSRLPPVLAPKFTLGDGLGLERGSIQLAWMQSLAIRLVPGQFEDDLGAFTALLQELRASHGAEGITPVMAAFIVRQAEALVRLLEREAGDDAAGAEGNERESVEVMMFGIRANKRFRDEEVVGLAAVETELVRLETASPDLPGLHTYLRRLEGSVRDVLSDMEEEAWQDVLDSTTADLHVHALSRPLPSAAPTLRQAQAAERRSHALHLAIRFLLVRARLASFLPNITKRLSIVDHSVASAAALYSTLLDVLPAVASSPTELAIVRQRQTSALYRILWSCAGTMDLPLAPETNYEYQHDRLAESVAPSDVGALAHALDAVESSLARVRTLPAQLVTSGSHAVGDPRILGISTRYWRRLLFALTLPAAPSRRAPPRSPAVRPPWHMLKRALTLIQACRHHDAECLERRAARAAYASPIFESHSLVIHLVRAALLGGMDPRAEGEERMEERLECVLGFFSALEEDGERIDRDVVVSAGEEVLGREWQGVIWKEWRAQARDMLERWRDAG